MLSLVFAFYDFLRAAIWSLWKYTVTWLAVRTGLYGVWVDHSGDWRSETLMRKTAEEVLRLKESVKDVRERQSAARTGVRVKAVRVEQA